MRGTGAPRITHQWFFVTGLRRDRSVSNQSSWPRDRGAPGCAPRGACDDLLAAAQSTVGQVTHFVHSAAPQRHEADHALAMTTETWERMRADNVDAGFH